MKEQVAIIGLGYVGLSLALAFAQKFLNTVGFDTDIKKVKALSQGIDKTGEACLKDLESSTLKVTGDPADLRSANFFVIAVPTPVDRVHCPDLSPLIRASQIVGKFLKPGAVVVYESTVYPGVTEEICGPILAQVSGLQQGVDFKLGYSPERINPGDQEHTLAKVVKIVSAEDTETLERIAKVYVAIIDAGIYRAPSIKTAEAAKLVENIQRDLNIALINEFSLICDQLDICTRDVLAAARTKWNFLPFQPGLVGGHCIAVDPYYLVARAEELGYRSELILAARRINDGMSMYLVQRIIKFLTCENILIKEARVGILGLTYKENVQDLRNTRVADVVIQLREFGVEPLVHDPLADAEEARREYDIDLANWEELHDLDVLVLAVIHRNYLEMPQRQLLACLRSAGILIDIKSVLDSVKLPHNITYWSL